MTIAKRPTRHMDAPNRWRAPRVRFFAGHHVPAWWVEQDMFDEAPFERIRGWDVKETASDAEVGAAAAGALLEPYIRRFRVA